MKKIFTVLLWGGFILIGGLAVYILVRPLPPKPTINTTTNTLPTNQEIIGANTPTININSEVTNISPPILANTNTAVAQPTVVVPIADFFSRVTKKPFGIYITPKTSPIQPEKFAGYHTGADAETTSAEKDIDVPIFSIAEGTVVFAGHVNGYGGVIMIRHTINGETVTALYGHLRITSLTKKKDDPVKIGQHLAVLGTGYSSETDGERKHLHFGIIKGTTINYKGYVQTQSELSAWDDPVVWLKNLGV